MVLNADVVCFLEKVLLKGRVPQTATQTARSSCRGAALSPVLDTLIASPLMQKPGRHFCLVLLPAHALFASPCRSSLYFLGTSVLTAGACRHGPSHPLRTESLVWGLSLYTRGRGAGNRLVPGGAGGMKFRADISVEMSKKIKTTKMVSN